MPEPLVSAPSPWLVTHKLEPMQQEAQCGWPWVGDGQCLSLLKGQNLLQDSPLATGICLLPHPLLDPSEPLLPDHVGRGVTEELCDLGKSLTLLSLSCSSVTWGNESTVLT